jgi:hypothetical protein
MGDRSSPNGMIAAVTRAVALHGAALEQQREKERCSFY